MARICDKIITEIMSAEDVNNLPEHIVSHIEGCAYCKAEYEKFLKMQDLLHDAVPETPDIKGPVMARLEGERIAPAPRRKNSFRMATLAAAAAALAVYVSVYGTGLMDSFVGKDAATEGIIVKDEDYGFDTAQNMSILADSADAPETAEPESAHIAQSTALKMAPKGASGGASDNTVTNEVVAEIEECKSVELYNDCADDLLESVRVVPDELCSRITEQQIEEVGREIYDLFVKSIDDFEKEYTYENLLRFANEYEK